MEAINRRSRETEGICMTPLGKRGPVHAFRIPPKDPKPLEAKLAKIWESIDILEVDSTPATPIRKTVNYIPKSHL